MNILLLSVSMLSVLVQDIVFNIAGKEKLKSGGSVYAFNCIMFAVCTLVFTALSIGSGVSLYSVIMGIIFGITGVFMYSCRIKAFAEGPMHITALIITASMIIPALSGVFLYGEKLSVMKVLSMALLISFIALGAKSGENGKKVNLKWIIACVVSFFAQGAIGVMQKIHQSSVHKDELFPFLACSFAVSFIYSAFAAKKGETQKFDKATVIFALVCGVCTFTMNYLNLKLSGIIPSQIFFPVVNGGPVILTSLCSVIIFKEKLTVRQTVGMVGGLLSLIGVCLL